MWKNCRMPDFDECKRNWLQVMESIMFIGFLSFFFYHSFWPLFPLLPVGYGMYLWLAKKKEEREKLQYRREFKELIYSISANLQAGYAIENAIIEARKDMVLLYGENARIIDGLDEMIKGIHNQIPIEELFYEMGQKSEIAEIIDFASVFIVAKRTGGNLVNIISSTSQVISTKIEVKNDIHTMIAAKQMEANIMNVMPFCITLYIQITSPGYYKRMYGNLQGILIMTICLVIYLVAFFMMQKICQIKYE